MHATPLSGGDSWYRSPRIQTQAANNGGSPDCEQAKSFRKCDHLGNESEIAIPDPKTTMVFTGLSDTTPFSL